VTRRLALVLGIAMAASACAGSPTAETSTTATTTTAATTTTTTATTTTTTASPGIPVDPELVPDGDPDLLAAMVLFPDELPPPYDDLALDPLDSGYSPAGGSLASALDSADEADDIIRFGEVAEFSTAYGDPNVLGVAFNATQFATPEGAAGYLDDWVADLAGSGSEPGDRFSLEDFHSEPLEGLGDQAIRVGYTGRLLLNDGSTSYRPGGAVVVRSGALALWVWGNGDQAARILDDFTAIVAERVEGASSGAITPRDHTLLGLTDPPTLALDSFAFTYEYGIEAPEAGFSVTVTGAFEGPDRASCKTTLSIDGFEPVDTYVVVAGTQVWLGDVAGYQEVTLRDPAALSALSGCPGHPNYWEVTKLHRIEVTDGEEVEVSGVPSLRTDLAGDTDALHDLGIRDVEASEFVRYEVTVAADGGWPIQLDVERSLPLAAALRLYDLPFDDLANPSHPATVYERLLLSHINDPDLTVDLPLLAG
jgi:hypothetical protein